MNSKDYEVYVGLGVHKDTITVATAAAGRGEPSPGPSRLDVALRSVVDL